MKIYYFSKIFNEEKILPYVFRHYDDIVDRYFIWNHASTDKTELLCRQNPKVTIFNLPPGPFDDEENRTIRNTAWKKHIGDGVDWVITCDFDEFLYHPNLLELLQKYKDEGITFPKTEGYQMFAEGFPTENKQIHEIIKTGRRAENYDKSIIFNPSISPNFSYGGHFANPEGNVKYSESTELKLLHYKIFGKEFIQKMMDRNKTLSQQNIALGCGTYSLDPNAKFNPKNEYELLQREANTII